MFSSVKQQPPESSFFSKSRNACLLSSVKSEIKSKLELDYFNFHEMYRVAGPHGHIITTPNIARFANRVKLLMGRSPLYSIEVFFENEGKGNILYHRHNREFTMSELSRLVKSAHWTIKKESYFISYSPFHFSHRTLNNPIRWIGKVGNFMAMNMVPGFRDSMLLIAKKEML